jgi:hypothetical protein
VSHGTWYATAKWHIAKLTEELPADASLGERKQALRPNNRPHEFVVTSWGRKSWQRAQKDYLAQFGPKSDAQVPPKHLSPLERMMARAWKVSP